MKSAIPKRTISVNGRKTSVTLEAPFWDELRAIAAAKRISVSELVSQIENEKSHDNLSSALRLFVLKAYQQGVIGRDNRPPCTPGS
jgi:predicted DNA-binding ribbon-helix-helix protein